MSIVRVGLSENAKYANGYDAIFGKKSSGAKKADAPKAVAKKAAGKKPGKGK